MKRRSIIPVLSLIALIFSCEPADPDTVLIVVDGHIYDHNTGDPLAAITISIEALKSPSSMGIISDGRRATVGMIKTDSKGYYKGRLNVFEDAETLEFILNPDQTEVAYTMAKHFIEIGDLNQNGTIEKDFILNHTADQAENLGSAILKPNSACT